MVFFMVFFLPDLIFCPKTKTVCARQHIPESDFKQTLTIRPPGGQGAVDPFWDPLNPEHGLPRDLVSSSFYFENLPVDASQCERDARELPLSPHSVNREKSITGEKKKQEDCKIPVKFPSWGAMPGEKTGSSG
ncbi:MAG: hypothetical protein SOY37_00690 [Oscillospiraceae bacterium]|nr:hypothetical protein [Oscillospiraceae bacterium]